MNASLQSPASVPQLVLQQVRKSFGEHVALNSISLEVQSGEVLALLGPSGCGKTTLLRCIAGLLNPDSGSIAIAGDTVSGPDKNLAPEERHLGMVFQDYALWPHMSLRKNVAFPLEMRGVAPAERKRQVDWALDLVGLLSQADRAPGTLSGGQQQRVALARAIVGEPRLLLMDEPLSNLDRSLREQLAQEIRELISTLGLTAVFVTHDQQEAYALADRVAVLQDGYLQQLDTPRSLFESPATPEIAGFLDIGSMLGGHCTDKGFIADNGQTRLPLKAREGYRGRANLLLPRRALTLVPQGSHTEPESVPVRVRTCLFQGERNFVKAALCGDVMLELTTDQTPAPGDHCGLRVDPGPLRGWGDDGRPLRFERFQEALDTVTV